MASEIAAFDDGVVLAASGREQRVMAACARMRVAWVELAGALYDFHHHEDWRTLGYESLEAWLAGPDIDLSRRQFFQLVEVFRELVIEREVPIRALAPVDMSKVPEVLPAIRRGQVSWEEGLADCEALTRSDLRERYKAMPPVGGSTVIHDPDAWHWENCPSCGSKIRVRDHD